MRLNFSPEGDEGERRQYCPSDDWGNLPGFSTQKISITELEHAKEIQEYVDTMRTTNLERVAAIRVPPQNHTIRREVLSSMIEGDVWDLKYTRRVCETLWHVVCLPGGGGVEPRSRFSVIAVPC
jgi:hypothetical protein